MLALEPRKPSLGLIMAFRALLCLFSAACLAKQPNIIFLFSDDHAPAAISAYGPSHLTTGGFASTPNIDRIAKTGMIFQSCYVANSICTPSRAAILTGQHSHHNGVYTLQDPMDPQRRHLAHWFTEAGYQTALYGKWHLETSPQGFQTWEVFRNQGEYRNPTYLTPDAPKKGHTEKGYADEVSTDKALGWLQKRDPSKPFLLCLHFKAPHRNWIPAERYARRFEGVTIPEPKTLLDDWKNRSDAITLNRQTIGRDMGLSDLKVPKPKGLQGDALRQWAYQRYIKDYLNTAQVVDDSVGRVLDWLKANGLEEDTIVIYASDQGFFTGEHGFFDKRLMYEPSTRMPLIVRAPGVTQAGSESRALASNIDFAPTLLELAGIHPKLSATEKFDGTSLVPLLRREIPDDWRTAVYYRYWEHNSGEHPVPNNFGIRTATHKIICYQGQPHNMRGASKIATPEEWELFDLVKDPDEMINVYKDPAYADIRKTLTAQLKAERERNGDSR